MTGPDISSNGALPWVPAESVPAAFPPGVNSSGWLLANACSTALMPAAESQQVRAVIPSQDKSR